MANQLWEKTLTVVLTNGTAVVNSTAETILFPDVTIPANLLSGGKALRLRAQGQYSNTSTPTLTFRLRWGGVSGTLLAASAACTTPSGVTAAMWEIDLLIVNRTDGATGTLMVNGRAFVYAAVAGTVASATGEGLVTPMTAGGVTTPAVATCDLTADTALSLTVTWGTQSSSNTITGISYVLESLN